MQFHDDIYVFHSPGCWTCQDHLENFEKHFPDFVLVDVSFDYDYFESIGVTLTPVTRMYKNGEVVYECSGMMFDTQIEEMRKCL